MAVADAAVAALMLEKKNSNYGNGMATVLAVAMAKVAWYSYS